MTRGQTLLLLTSLAILVPTLQNERAFAVFPLPLLLGDVSDLNPDADLALVTPSAPVIEDISGDPLSPVKAGRQHMIAVNATNVDKVRDWASVVLVEVRDSNGITVWFNWHTQIIRAGDTIGLGMSWMPEHAGQYEVRTFVISGLNNPRVLSGVVQTDVTVS